MITPPYARLVANLRRVQKSIGPRPLTITEKFMLAHLDENFNDKITRGLTYLKLRPDRVAMQDASAQMALLQFMNCGRKTSAVPASIHCDHLITAELGADADVKRSVATEHEIYSFLEQSAKKFGIGFWKPGSGIIHQIVLENYAAPGALMLGTDSHTPNAGGLGMIAIGVGGADAVDAMADIPWELKAPKIMGVRLTGKLSPWCSPKDVILKLAGDLTVRGGTGYIIEYFGPGVESLSCTGMATICNMGAEVGATTSVFPYTVKMNKYLRATGRAETADMAESVNAETGYLTPDKASEQSYDKVIEIDLSDLEPYINGPFTPDLATPLSKMKDAIKKNNWPSNISSALIGSCTNSSYEDMSRAASLAKQAKEHGLTTNTEFLVTPGSEQIRATIARDGQTEKLTDIGAKVLANACGPCIGQWKRSEDAGKEDNVILTSFNRNFKGRNDGNSKTMNFLASPEIVTCMAVAGRLDFNPVTDSLTSDNGTPFRFQPPTGDELPGNGFEAGLSSYEAPVIGVCDESVHISIDPNSTRLQKLESFAPWSGNELCGNLVLIKVRGKCTTDHISAAGKWLRYKGHLDNLANNTLIGAVNDESGQVNSVTNQLTGAMTTIPQLGRDYKAAGKPWAVIADENYGEGSAREHAALQPRYLGCTMIVAKSFARIHETNLKKQGVLPLTFADVKDYKRISSDSIISTVGLKDLVENGSGQVYLDVKQKDGSRLEVQVNHSMSVDQCAWFKHGSALNMIRAQNS